MDAAAAALSSIGRDLAGLARLDGQRVAFDRHDDLARREPCSRISRAFSSCERLHELVLLFERLLARVEVAHCVCGSSLMTVSPLQPTSADTATSRVDDRCARHWLAVFRPRSYGFRMKDARSLDELANDLPTHYVLDDDTLDARRVHPIIQSCHAARARQGRKPGPEAGARSATSSRTRTLGPACSVRSSSATRARSARAHRAPRALSETPRAARSSRGGHRTRARGR